MALSRCASGAARPDEVVVEVNSEATSTQRALAARRETAALHTMEHRRSSIGTTECMICLEPLTAQAPVQRATQRRFSAQLRANLPMACCSRRFHQGCIETWLRGNMSCPNCRAKDPAAFVVLRAVANTVAEKNKEEDVNDEETASAPTTAVKAVVPWKPGGWAVDQLELPKGKKIDPRDAAKQLRWLTRPGDRYKRKIAREMLIERVEVSCINSIYAFTGLITLAILGFGLFVALACAGVLPLERCPAILATRIASSPPPPLA